MNIFKVSEKERKEIISKILNNITPEQLLEELIEEGLEVTKEPIINDMYIKKNIYIEDNIYRDFNIHNIRISHKFIVNILKKQEKVNERSMEEAA